MLDSDEGVAEAKALLGKATVKLAANAVGIPERDALLALQGIGLMPFHDSPTFSGKVNQLAFYALPEVIGENAVVKICEEDAEGGSEKRSVIEMNKSGEPVMLNGTNYNRVDFKIGSHNYSVESAGMQMAGNFAKSATASASSTESGHSASAAIDGDVNGYPVKPAAEWSANHETNLFAVANGLEDAATNNTASLERMAAQKGEKGRKAVDQVEVIWTSPTIPEDPMIWRRDLEPEVKAGLKQRAAQHGWSMEEDVRQILRSAVNQTEQPQVKLGSRIAPCIKLF